MISSDAIRKILYLDATDEPARSSKAGHQYSCTYDGPLMGCASFEVNSSVIPRSKMRASGVFLGTCTLGLLSMRSRHKEKWWSGLFFVTVLSYFALKAHKVENGLLGHQIGFYSSCMLMIGSGARMAIRSGSRSTMAPLHLVSWALLWYEVGRFHLWMDYMVQFKRDAHEGRGTFNLLSEFVSQDIETEYLPFRSLHTK